MILYYITDRTQFPGDERERRRALLDKIGEAARAGVDFIQLREKDLSTRELETVAREAVSVVRSAVRSSVHSSALRTENWELGTRLLINSRMDVALAAGADGVHLRADDVGPHEVRRMLEVAGPQGLKPGFLSTAGGTAESRALPETSEAGGPRASWLRVYRPDECGPMSAADFVVAVSCHTKADVLRAEAEGATFAVFAPVFEKRDRPGTPPAGLAALRDACQVKIPVLALGGVTLENAASCIQAGAAGIAAIRLFQENRIEDVVRVLRQI